VSRGVEEGTREKRLSGWWALLAVAVGLPVAILVGQFATEGTAEIAGVMAATLTFCLRAFWDFRAKSWFAPLITGWIILHLAALLFLVVPMKIAGSKLLLQLVWPEYLAFVALVWLMNRTWKRRPNG
jgi:xanthine/uracil permease